MKDSNRYRARERNCLALPMHLIAIGTEGHRYHSFVIREFEFKSMERFETGNFSSYASESRIVTGRLDATSAHGHAWFTATHYPGHPRLSNGIW